MADKKDGESPGRFSSQAQFPAPTASDGGYGWVIVACGFAIQLFFVGTMNMYGVYLYDLTDYLGASQAAMGLVSSVYMVLLSLAGDV